MNHTDENIFEIFCFMSPLLLAINKLETIATLSYYNQQYSKYNNEIAI